MARIRTVKPELARHELLYDLEKETGLPIRFSWVMLFTCCDREGRFEWRPRRLKAEILPYDDVNFPAVLDALASRDLVVKYEVAGKVYGCIPTWHKHQSINQREAQSIIPPPEDACICVHVQTPEEYIEARGVPNGVNIPKGLRQAIFARDEFACVRCGASEDLTVDHVFPQSIGGTHVPKNLRTLCRSCNSARPVAGDALVSDLALDGLTVGDMERICAHVQAHAEDSASTCGREGKGREGEGRAKRFTPPTVEDVREYVAERGSPVDPSRFHDFYTANGWVQGKGKPVKDWKACVRTWERGESTEPEVHAR